MFNGTFSEFQCPLPTIKELKESFLVKGFYTDTELKYVVAWLRYYDALNHQVAHDDLSWDASGEVMKQYAANFLDTIGDKVHELIFDSFSGVIMSEYYLACTERLDVDACWELNFTPEEQEEEEFTTFSHLRMVEDIEVDPDDDEPIDIGADEDDEADEEDESEDEDEDDSEDEEGEDEDPKEEDKNSSSPGVTH